VSLRPIVADTEEEAWARADAVLAAAQARAAASGGALSGFGKNAVGSHRLVAAAEQADVHDKRLWTALAKVTGGAGNSTSLVGTYEQVADGLLDYVDLGVTTLLIRGFDPLEDAKKYGRLIELVRAGAADRRPALAG
jgi:alkanesulfonate monooxygenase